MSRLHPDVRQLSSLKLWLSQWNFFTSRCNNRQQSLFTLNHQIHPLDVDIHGRNQAQFPPDFDSFYFPSLNYKVYLSFEKLNCRNYITGKVYINAMQYDMIPIVLGAFKDDYGSTLPPHSFIIADDHKSIRELIDCLLYLDKDGAAYAAYFAWKEHGTFAVSLTTDI
ncbi:Glycoprotein 3-alpha-L-fucosyltransferase A [Echinococcus granulosus]|nr:Glycoprotein 3-alpha-L-fucosyltransferase A [Echinococcus granulosus]